MENVIILRLLKNKTVKKIKMKNKIAKKLSLVIGLTLAMQVLLVAVIKCSELPLVVKSYGIAVSIVEIGLLFVFLLKYGAEPFIGEKTDRFQKK